MSLPLLATQYNSWLVALSFLIAVFAAYVALDLARRVHNSNRMAALAWGLGGSLAMGTGIWSMHFVGMLAMSLPFAVGYGYAVTALSWVAAVGVSAIALYLASYAQLTLVRLVSGAVTMGAGICAMHYTGMVAMDMAPGIRWDVGWVLISIVIAVVASTVSLMIFFGLRRLKGRQARWGQLVAALAMGAGVSGMHYSGMAAAGFVDGSVCLSAGQLHGHSLTFLVSAGTLLLLGLTLVSSMVEAHLHRATQLASSLQVFNDELQQIAFRDALTGLPNRLLFDDRVNVAMQRCTRDGGTLAVLFVDLDGFKAVNDSFGHDIGDKVLRKMAQRLATQARACDTVARVGGDEFVLLLEQQPDTTSAAQVAQRIIDAVIEPVVMGGHEVRLSCSVGIAMSSADVDGGQLRAHADAAMYSAKRAGGSTYAFFAPHMHAGVREQIELQADLRQALASNGLELHYQPKVKSGDGTITGVEALARWSHPTRGMVGPAQFIPIAERFGLINALGDWVIHQACQQIAAWQREGLQLCVAINLSVHQLRQDDLVQRVEGALQKYNIDPCMLMLEITESVAMKDADCTLQMLRRLEGIGVQIAIDDFGTGYSSLSYLRQLHVSQLKIDRSFVQDLADSADARAIVSAVVQLAHALGLNVVAEGVETGAQRDVLASIGCDELQGYLYAKPMPAAAISPWMQAQGQKAKVDKQASWGVVDAGPALVAVQQCTSVSTASAGHRPSSFQSPEALPQAGTSRPLQTPNRPIFCCVQKTAVL